MSTPSTPLFSPSDQEANRRIWAGWLRRSDWRMIPRSRGRVQECHTPWDVGYALAYAWWPLSGAIIDQHFHPMDIEDAIMQDCYGLNESGVFAAAELPDTVHRRVMMASQAARSAQPYPDRSLEDARNVLEDLSVEQVWSLFSLSNILIDIWEYDSSPMRGAIIDPDNVAILIADILDAAPPSLLEPDLSEFGDE